MRSILNITLENPRSPFKKLKERVRFHVEVWEDGWMVLAVWEYGHISVAGTVSSLAWKKTGLPYVGHWKEKCIIAIKEAVQTYLHRQESFAALENLEYLAYLEKEGAWMLKLNDDMFALKKWHVIHD